MTTLAKLASVAPAEKPSIKAHVVEHEQYFAIMIPKSIAVENIRESNTDKKSLYVSAVPVGDKAGSAVVTLNVTEGENSAPVRFRLSAMNLFVANK
jgi:hypothetical protein